MHPLLVLLAFALAAGVTYVVVLGLLTALSIPGAGSAGEIDAEPASDPAARGEDARH
ncbi:hypothetical protein AAII07_28350 [Microvirga sp. 0TCS3.31]